MSPGVPLYIYDGPAEMMACSSPCLDRMGFFRSGESKKTEGLLRFKNRCSVLFSVNHVVGFSQDKYMHLTLEFVSPDTMGPDYDATLNIIIHTYPQVAREA